MLKLDSHQHFWKFNSVRDNWITADMQNIRRNFLPEDLEPILNRYDITGCIAVQADQSEIETQFLLQLAERHSFIKGVVGWVDLHSPDLKDRLAYYQSFTKLKGFRHIVQAEPPGFMSNAVFLSGISLLKDYGFTYDILIKNDQLKEAIQLVQQNPEQPFVLDHLAKPNIKENQIQEWRDEINEIALCENVYCKLSGMVTEADLKFWKKDDMIPYMEVSLEAFGADRLMFGSDWPVCKLAAEYDEVLGLVDGFLKTLSLNEQTLIWGENASSFYRLGNI